MAVLRNKKGFTRKRDWVQYLIYTTRSQLTNGMFVRYKVLYIHMYYLCIYFFFALINVLFDIPVIFTTSV